MFTKRSLIVILFVALLVGGCATAFRGQEAVAEPPAPMVGESDQAGDFFAPRAVTNVQTEVVSQAGEVQERLIIRTGDLRIVVEDTEGSLAAIGDLANQLEGWVVSTNVYQVGEAKEGSITIRVPSAQFDAAMSQIKAMALEVNGETTTGQDVTEEYVDLSARLANLEATAGRVRNFLDSAQDVEEALAVNAELSRLEGEIEAMKGRLQYLSQSAAFSSITVGVTPDILAQPIEIAGWRPEGVARDALEALVNALEGLASFLIWVAIFVLPLVLIIGLPVWFVGRRVLRRRRQRRQTAAAA
ncbi:MAG: DUF4349 domain-containing protein [Chloroflexota bacterium]